jgi:hypothetical protein
MIHKVNGITLKTPASCTWGFNFISGENSGRDTLDSLMHIEELGTKRKLSGVTWNNITDTEATEILQLVTAKRMMTLQYDDLLSGNLETRIFYISDPSAQVYRWNVGMKIIAVLGFDFIEQ